MRIVGVVGTRPQLIKAAALVPALAGGHEHLLVDTGQHWDESMAGAFFAELGLPRPDHSLGIGGGTADEQIGRMVPAVAAILRAERPDAVIVYGDTNSTLAGALASASVSTPVAHVEAGLRSFDRRMPEEANRVLTDHLSRWLFAPTPTAVSNLAAEGIREGVVLVGDLMQDLASRAVPDVRNPASVAALGLEPGSYLFATIHRAENRAPDAMRAWIALLAGVSQAARPVVLALHPGTHAALAAAGIALPATMRVIDPQGYRASLGLQLHAAAVLTDSGGVQREAAWFGVPCLVLRDTTEWVEAVEASGGSMVVVGLDRALAARELDRLAPVGMAPAAARSRAIGLTLPPSGAADAIAAALDGAGR